MWRSKIQDPTDYEEEEDYFTMMRMIEDAQLIGRNMEIFYDRHYTPIPIHNLTKVKPRQETDEKNS